jgi:parallel beta-helix repeat protein
MATDTKGVQMRYLGVAATAATAFAVVAVGATSAQAQPVPEHHRIITVTTTIQAAVDEARPGDTIRVPPGVYREAVTVDAPGLTMTGGQDAVLEGDGLGASVGIRVASADGSRLDGFTLAGMVIRDFGSVGVMLDRVDNFRLTGTSYVDDGEYGLFPIRSSGRADHNTVTGADDTGLYVGQSSHVDLDHNVASDNTIGIEVELSTVVTVADNITTGNTVGIVVQIMPGRPLTTTEDVTVTGNLVSANNRPNDVTDPTELLSMLPSGIGVLNAASDAVTITSNVIINNPTAGIGVVSLPAAVAALDPRLEPHPDHTVVAANLLWGNGLAPDPKVAPLQPADIVWDGTGTDNCFDHAATVTTFPTVLPAC